MEEWPNERNEEERNGLEPYPVYRRTAKKGKIVKEVILDRIREGNGKLSRDEAEEKERGVLREAERREEREKKKRRSRVWEVEGEKEQINLEEGRGRELEREIVKKIRNRSAEGTERKKKKRDVYPNAKAGKQTRKEREVKLRVELEELKRWKEEREDKERKDLEEKSDLEENETIISESEGSGSGLTSCEFPRNSPSRSENWQREEKRPLLIRWGYDEVITFVKETKRFILQYSPREHPAATIEPNISALFATAWRQRYHEEWDVDIEVMHENKGSTGWLTKLRDLALTFFRVHSLPGSFRLPVNAERNNIDASKASVMILDLWEMNNKQIGVKDFCLEIARTMQVNEPALAAEMSQEVMKTSTKLGKKKLVETMIGIIAGHAQANEIWSERENLKGYKPNRNNNNISGQGSSRGNFGNNNNNNSNFNNNNLNNNTQFNKNGQFSYGIQGNNSNNQGFQYGEGRHLRQYNYEGYRRSYNESGGGNQGGGGGQGALVGFYNNNQGGGGGRGTQVTFGQGEGGRGGGNQGYQGGGYQGSQGGGYQGNQGGGYQGNQGGGYQGNQGRGYQGGRGGGYQGGNQSGGVGYQGNNQGRGGGYQGDGGGNQGGGGGNQGGGGGNQVPGDSKPNNNSRNYIPQNASTVSNPITSIPNNTNK